MQRRTLLKLGLGSAAVLAVAGTGVAWLRPGLDAAGLTPAGRTVFAAVARAVLDGVLPKDGAQQADAIEAQLRRLDTTIAALPRHARDELSQLLALLASPPGRLAFAGLAPSWAEADVPALQSALVAMRDSSLSLRQQAYHALRDLTNAAYFADPAAWPALQYPGPVAL